MFKKLLTLFLIILYMFSGNAVLVYLAGHKINLTYIIQNLCVEKDKAENMCGGTCQLKENLEKSDNENDEKGTENLSLLSFILSLHVSNKNYSDINLFDQKIIYNNSKIVRPIKKESLPDTPPPRLLLLT
ncbi:MAG TPA: hypothetical protein VK870_13375 [Ignavibacteriaceae bacterium]|nr:hypothetical protein [Ignavibacteriaceae bacterium]